MLKIVNTTVHFLILAALTICSTGCAPSKEQVRVEFRLYYQEKPINCNLVFDHTENNWSISTLGMFLSSIETTGVAENKSSVELIKSDWQTPSSQTTLLWFTPNCDSSKLSNKQSAQSNTSLHLLMQKKDFEQLKTLTFSLSVPFKENHANPLSQASPINNPDMFWSWQNGHKFVRLDLRQQGGIANWAFHLGSLGCLSQSTLRPPVSTCAQENRFAFTVEVPEKLSSELSRLIIKLDIEALLRDIDITAAPPCMFELEQDASCRLLIQNMQHNRIFSSYWQAGSR